MSPESSSEPRVPEELRWRMEKFAEGLIPTEEMEELCAQILSHQEWIRTFAEILARRQPGVDA